MRDTRVRNPPPLPGWPIWGIISRVGGVIGGILWPTEMGSGELTPEQQREGRERYERNEAEQIARERAELERRIEDLEVARERAWPTPEPVPLPPMPAPQPVPLPLPLPLPSPAPSPTAAPQPRFPDEPILDTSQWQLPRFPQRSRQTAPRAWRMTNTVPQITNTPTPTTPTTPSSPPFPTPAPTPTPTLPQPSPPTLAHPSPPFTDPLTQNPSLTGFNPQLLGSAPPATRTPSRSRECQCDPKPKKKKQRRKCAVRGDVVWASGPNKGKRAGSRCITFEDFL
jgi:hypothetical protein